MPKKFLRSGCEPAVALGDVGRNRKGGSIELVDEKSVTTRELLARGADGIGEVDGFLVDDQFLETERHAAQRRK
jgi:hypothetical protein